MCCKTECEYWSHACGIVFPSLLISGFSFLMILVSCCSVVFLPRNYLFHNPFSLFLPLSFYSAAMFRCQSAVILMCVLLFITVLIFPLSAEYFCFAWTSLFYLLPFPLKRKKMHSSKVTLKQEFVVRRPTCINKKGVLWFAMPLNSSFPIVLGIQTWQRQEPHHPREKNKQRCKTENCARESLDIIVE